MTSDAQAAVWHVVKYMPDLKRREPRNVGIVLATPDGWMTKFLGQDEDGSIKGPLGHELKVDVYRTWVDYYQRKASSDAWEDVHRNQAHHPVNFLAEVGGEVIAESPTRKWQAILDDMFAELVQPDRPVPGSKPARPGTQKWVLEQARSALQLAEVPFIEKVKVKARYDDHNTTVPFQFQHGRNGSTTLMDGVPVRGREAAAKARELRTRIVAARDAGVDARFFTFYSGNTPERQLDEILAPLEREATTVDVSNVEEAAETLQEAISA